MGWSELLLARWWEARDRGESVLQESCRVIVGEDRRELSRIAREARSSKGDEDDRSPIMDGKNGSAAGTVLSAE